MKKTIILAAAALTAVLASCSKVETYSNTTEENAVTFGVYTPRGVDTKATFGTQTTETLKTDGFGVIAYYHPSGAYTTSSIPDFMYNTQVTNAGSAWTYSPVKYWPNEHGDQAYSSEVDKLSFLAYAPWVEVSTANLASGSTGLSEGITALTGNATEGDAKVTFKVPAKASEQIDLLWGVAASDATSEAVQGTNTITTGKPFMNLIKQQVDGKVKFQFNHALAKIALKVQAVVDATDPGKDVDAATKIYVRKVEILGNFNNQGVLNLNNTEASKPLWESLTAVSGTFPTAFTFNDGLKDDEEKTADAAESADFDTKFIQGGAGVSKTAEDLLVAKHEMLVVPTDLTTGGFKVKITYDVETTDPNLSTTLTDGTTKGRKIHNVITTKDAVTTLNFEAGKSYTITLKLGMTSVAVDAVVNETWDASAADVNLPGNVA